MQIRNCVGLLFATAGLAACGTFLDPSDAYSKGLRAYENGNFDAARSEWVPLAAKGDCDAQYRLGALYFYGQGVKRDIPTAVTLWSAAAERGQPRAQFALGDINFNSPRNTRFYCRAGCDGLELDAVIAYKWYLVAEKRVDSENDKAYVASVLPRIRARLSSAEKTAGEKKASDWRPTPDDCRPRAAF